MTTAQPPAADAVADAGAPGADISGTRIIKKYPNRRLYDTHDSRYVTLADIARLVFERQTFEVVDQKTGDTLTCPILLQIMAEQAHSGQSPLSRELLAQMIRVYSGKLPGALRVFLQGSLALFLDQHQKIDALLDGQIQNDPVEALTALTDQNLHQWIALNKALLRAVAAGECEPGST